MTGNLSWTPALPFRLSIDLIADRHCQQGIAVFGVGVDHAMGVGQTRDGAEPERSHFEQVTAVCGGGEDVGVGLARMASMIPSRSIA